MMLASGLLTLNIHEALTFDGIELCLHPDLFAGGANQHPEHVAPASASVKPSPLLSREQSSSNSSTSQASISGLFAGDMIEIRVWDPLPHDAIKNVGSTMFRSQYNKRHSPPGSVQPDPIQVTSPPPPISSTPLTQVKAFSEGLPIGLNHEDVSVGLPLDDGSIVGSDRGRSHGDKDVRHGDAPSSGIRNGDGIWKPTHHPPTKTVVMAPNSVPASNASSVESSPTQHANLHSPGAPTNALPPMFPRKTLDVAAPLQKRSLLKPIHRRAFSHAVAPSTSVQYQHIPSSSSVPTSPFKSLRSNQSQHNREISDMTIDTHQLDPSMLMDIHPTESHDEIGMDDSIWSKVSSTHKLRLSFVLLVTEKMLTSLKGNSRTQVSILRQVADLYSLSNYDLVTIHKIEPQDEEEVLQAVSADFVLVTIKDQFISRGDMHFFQQALIGTWIYEGQRLSETTRGIKANAREIRHGNFNAKSGIITEKTMITFRSRSSRIIWLVQLSCEMWDYTCPYDNKPESVCEIYFDQWIRFVYKLFAKWKDLEVTHSLTVIFFSRTYLTNGQKSTLGCQDVYGRIYEDHFKPVIENETYTDWDSLVVRIKEEFVKYPLDVGWNLTDRRPSNATQGNVLEAINVTLNLMQFHYLDRDLHRTGNSIVVISPGCGVFEVDKELAGITYQRMMDNGIGSDMLSLGLPPLHIAPFFLYNNDYRGVETRGVDTSETYFEVPHWMHLSFISYDRNNQQSVLSKPKETDQLKNKGNKGRVGLDIFNVGANGFIRPRKPDSRQQQNPKAALFAPHGPPLSFSALGNAAASPKRKAKPTQERQLISGRYFRDILEACRPKVAGITIPSALSEILKMYQMVEDTVSDCGSKTTKSVENSSALKEWGTVDFDEVSGGHRSPQRVRGGDSRIIRKLPAPEPSNDDNSDGASSASSFASHLSSLFGVSYDKVMWNQFELNKSTIPVMQMQRSASLDFDVVDDVLPYDFDDVMSDDSVSSTSKSDSDKGSMKKECSEAEGMKSLKLLRHADRLRKMMADRDEKSFTPFEDTARSGSADVLGVDVPSSDTSMSFAPSNTSVRQRVSEKPSVVGGLGAALSQYGSVADLSLTNSISDTQLAGRISRIASTGILQPHMLSERIKASSPLYPFIGQLQSRDVTAQSPLLIPPFYQITTSDPPDSLKLDDSQRGNTNLGEIRESVRSPHLISENYHSAGAVPTLITPRMSGNLDYIRPRISSMPRSPTSTTVSMLRPMARSPNGPGSGFRLGSSPPSSGIRRENSTQRSRAASQHSSSVKNSARRKKAFNPFRQSDEDEVLAMRSHNRRRWSHVFPVGEVEFKRHAGPNWNSLTSPAILPLSVDYFPSPQELRDESTFQFSPYTVTLGGLDKKYYSTHAELLMEMVRQRITQDYQLVTSAAVQESESRAEIQRQAVQYTGRISSKVNRRSTGRNSFVPSLPTIKHDSTGTIKHYLTMGHRIQILNYDPNSDTIEIVYYNRKSAQNDPLNIYTYRYLLFSKADEKFSKAIQTFKKYSEQYKWTKVDNLICGEEDRTMEEGMRFRRNIFGLIPVHFKDVVTEQAYIAKFKRLVEYLSKLREKDTSQSDLDIEIVSSTDKKPELLDDVLNSRRETSDTMIRFTIQLKKGKRDPFEWIEIAVDSVFDTARSYRIILNWLVASSAKVETQVQLLHRRCTQFGLNLIQLPQASLSRNLYLQPFILPPIICVRNKENADRLEEEFFSNTKKHQFFDDGIYFTDPQVLECVDNSDEFDFPKHRGGKIRSIPSRQYIHQSGLLCIRNIRDLQGWSMLAAIENTKHAAREHGKKETIKRVLIEIESFLNATAVAEKITTTTTTIRGEQGESFLPTKEVGN